MNDFEYAMSIEFPLRGEWNIGYNMNEVETDKMHK